MMGPKIRAIPLVLAAALLLPASSAWAVTFDFAAFADGSTAGLSAHSVPAAEGGHLSFSLTSSSGITVTVTPNPTQYGADFNDYYAYLDASNGGNPAGLGVCREESCAGNDDDNVTVGEGLLLHFSELVVLNTVQFRDQDHVHVFDGPGSLVDINSMSYNLGSSVVVQMMGTDFYFDWNNSDFYIEKVTFAPAENPVPEPATLGLLGAGLLGLAARARRRRS